MAVGSVNAAGANPVPVMPSSGTRKLASVNTASSLAVGDAYLSTATKAVKPNVFQKAVKAVSLAAAGALVALNMNSCTPEPMDPPDIKPIDTTIVKPPVDTTIVKPPVVDTTVVSKLTPAEKTFMGVMKKMGMVDDETKMLDSLVYNDGRSGQNISWKVDTKNSKNDTLVIKEVIFDSKPQGYGIRKFYKSGNDLVSDIYDSRNFKYNDTQYDFNQTRKLMPNDTSVIETNLGKPKWCYTPRDAKTINVETIKSGGKSIITKLFAAMKK